MKQKKHKPGKQQAKRRAKQESFKTIGSDGLKICFKAILIGLNLGSTQLNNQTSPLAVKKIAIIQSSYQKTEEQQIPRELGKT